MKTKLLTVSCISSLSLAMLASCSDSTSDLYNPATPIAGVEGEGYSSADAGYIIASSDSETGSQLRQAAQQLQVPAQQQPQFLLAAKVNRVAQALRAAQ